MSLSIKIVFFGTSNYAVTTLQALASASEYSIVAVVTQPDRPVGRKHVLSPTPVKLAAQELCLPVFENPRDIIDIQADVGVLVYYGKILSTKVLNQFSLGILNIHPSLLPAWRGPSPVQAAILAGDTKTGVTVMKLDTSMDTGPILAQRSVNMDETDAAQVLYDKLFSMGTELLLECLPEYLSGKLIPIPQSQLGVSYSHLITRDDGRIIGSDTSRQIINKLRAYHPWPGVFCVWKGRRLKILEAHTDSTVLALDRVQPEGKQPMTFKDFQNGNPDFLLADI